MLRALMGAEYGTRATEPLILVHAAGEQEDFRPLFLPGPPALVQWSGAVLRGTVPVQRATKCDGLYPRRTLVGRVARGTGISAPRPEIPARSWRTAGSPYYFSAPGWGKCSRTPAKASAR